MTFVLGRETLVPEPAVGAPSPAPPAATPSTFTCVRSPKRVGAVWIHLSGELDVSGADLLREELREAQASSYLVAVDLRDLDFIDCAGLGVLLAAEGAARLTGRSLVLIRGAGPVARMLETAGVLGRFEIVEIP